MRIQYQGALHAKAVHGETTWRQLVLAATLVATAATLTACGGGGGGGGGGNDNQGKTNDPPATTSDTSPATTPSALSADQQAFEALNTAGGSFRLSWNFPFEDTTRTGTVDFIYWYQYKPWTQSPAGGPQTQAISTQFLNDDMVSLGTATSDTPRYLVDGKIWLGSSTRTVSYAGDGINLDYAGHNDGTDTTTVLTEHITQVKVTPLSGLMQQSPAALLAAVPVENWAGFGIFKSDATWAPGAAYITTRSTLVHDTVLIQDCSNKATVTQTTGTSPTPCTTGGDLDHFFPVVLKNGQKPFENDVATDGTVQSGVHGARMWIANQPLPLGESSTVAYRVYVELNGNVYQGLLQRDGTLQRNRQADGSVVDYLVSLNKQATDSVRDGLISKATGTGTEQASFAKLDTTDLYGIGGSGINGALTPADLRRHYHIPDSMTGEGQDHRHRRCPGRGRPAKRPEHLQPGLRPARLHAGNRLLHAHRPVDRQRRGQQEHAVLGQRGGARCRDGPCHRAEGAHHPGDGGQRLGQGAPAAINQAGHQAGVTAVSMSFGITSATDANGRRAPGCPLLTDTRHPTAPSSSRATGDSGYFPAGVASYPAESPYVTAISAWHTHYVGGVGGGRPGLALRRRRPEHLCAPARRRLLAAVHGQRHARLHRQQRGRARVSRCWPPWPTGCTAPSWCTTVDAGSRRAAPARRRPCGRA
ncbi:MAG: hypothetical protein QM749_17085 [Aquabacterium sp.]